MFDVKMQVLCLSHLSSRRKSKLKFCSEILTLEDDERERRKFHTGQAIQAQLLRSY